MNIKKVLIVVALIAVFYVSYAINETFGNIMFWVCLAIGVFVFRRDKKQKQPAADAQAGTRTVTHYDDSIAYHYKDVGVFVPYTEIFERPDVVVGAVVTFRQEPTNQYDSRAVAVVIGRKRIGYLYRGRLQDMANDWLESGVPVSGIISSVNPYCDNIKKDGIKIDLYFYE